MSLQERVAHGAGLYGLGSGCRAACRTGAQTALHADSLTGAGSSFIKAVTGSARRAKLLADCAEPLPPARRDFDGQGSGIFPASGHGFRSAHIRKLNEIVPLMWLT